MKKIWNRLRLKIIKSLEIKMINKKKKKKTDAPVTVEFNSESHIT